MKHLALFFLSLTTIVTGCTSQDYDEPMNAVTAAEDTGLWGTVSKDYKTNLSEAAAVSDAEAIQEFYKDENGFWYPIDENARITARQMNEIIIGHGWIQKPCSRDILEDGTTKAVTYTSGLSVCSTDTPKFSFHPGYVRRYGKRYWDHDFYFHDDSRLDTDAPIIGYTSSDDRDWLMPIKLINDNTLVVIFTCREYIKDKKAYVPAGEGYYIVLQRVPDEELAEWEAKYTADYWGN